MVDAISCRITVLATRIVVFGAFEVLLLDGETGRMIPALISLTRSNPLTKRYPTPPVSNADHQPPVGMFAITLQ